MRSERSPLPTWAPRTWARSACLFSSSCSNRRARSTRRALALFLCWLFSSWQITTSPEGRWVMRTAESVVFTLWPPGPPERYTSMRSSSCLMSISVGSTSGSTATVTAEVWIRPPASVTGTRCTRCTPLSWRRFSYTLLPVTENTISLKPRISVWCEDRISTDQPRPSAKRLYMRNRSAANRAASSPPVPGLGHLLQQAPVAPVLLHQLAQGPQLPHQLGVPPLIPYHRRVGGQDGELLVAFGARFQFVQHALI